MTTGRDPAETLTATSFGEQQNKWRQGVALCLPKLLVDLPWPDRVRRQ